MICLRSSAVRRARHRRRAGRETLEDLGLNSRMVDADAAGECDAERSQQSERPRACELGRGREGERGENERGHMRVALPPAHLARIEPAEILRAERAGEQSQRQEQGNQPRRRRWRQLGRAARAGRDRFAHRDPSATSSRARPTPCSPAGEPLQRIERVIELEVLDALLLQLVGFRREARIGRVVGFE